MILVPKTLVAASLLVHGRLQGAHAGVSAFCDHRRRLAPTTATDLWLSTTIGFTIG
jgi:hypothetical protein